MAPPSPNPPAPPGTPAANRMLGWVGSAAKPKLWLGSGNRSMGVHVLPWSGDRKICGGFIALEPLGTMIVKTTVLPGLVTSITGEPAIKPGLRVLMLPLSGFQVWPPSVLRKIPWPGVTKVVLL